jgi:OOP family OmpA-OmpF porin
MKKTLIALAFVAAGSVVAPAFAQDSTDLNGFFVSGTAGRATVNKGRYNGHDMAYGLQGGYRWNVAPGLKLGVEGGYTDLGNIHAKSNYYGSPVADRRESNMHGWNAGVNAHYDITQNWYVGVRGGLWAFQGRGITHNDLSSRSAIDKTSWYAGVGTGYNFNDHVSLGVSYDHYDAKKDGLNLSTNVPSIKAEYRF